MSFARAIHTLTRGHSNQKHASELPCILPPTALDTPVIHVDAVPMPACGAVNATKGQHH